MLLPDPSVSVFDALWWSDREALSRDYQTLYQDDRATLLAVLDRAYEDNDLKTTITAGSALVRAAEGAGLRVLRKKDALHIGEALLRLRRFAEAAALFEHPKLIGMAAPKLLFARASALAGSGRLEEALTCLDRAIAARPGFRDALAFRDSVAVAVALRPGAAVRTKLYKMLRLAKAYAAIGLEADARALVERLLAGQASEEPSFAERLEIAELALELADPARVRAYLLAAEPEPKREARRQALLAMCDARQGGVAAGSLPAPTPDKALATGRALVAEAAGDLETAIAGLSALSVEHPLDRDIRRALARTMGLKVLDTVRPTLAAGNAGPPRIFNLVPFFDEFTMLRMRLEEMAGWVDHFVIVEARQTHTGLDKPLSFRARKAEFAAFADRITHVVVDAFPPYVDAPWARDFFQRDMALRGIVGQCGPEDLILLTDADELVDRRALKGFDGDFAGLLMPTFKYFLNYRPVVGHRKHIQVKSSIWRARYLQRFGSSYLRFFMACDAVRTHVIPNAGWHFTTMMDAAAVARKVDSYSHQEQTKKHLRDEAHYRGLLDRIRAGEPEPDWERCEIDDTYPAFIRARPEEVAHLLL